MDDLSQTFIVEAIDLTHDALGVCRLEDGYTVFVEDMLKGESAEIIITSRGKNYGFGKVVHRLSKSPYRITPKCRHFYECGGCNLMHIEYDLQLSFKRYRIETMLRKNHLDHVIVKDMLQMAQPYFYRNKVEIKFRQGPNGVEAGFFQTKSHVLVNLEECHIIPKKMYDIIALIRNICNELKIDAYDDERKTGILKSVIIRESHTSKEIIILFQLAKALPLVDRLVHKLISRFPEVSGMATTLTKDESNLSPDPITIIYGKDHIIETILQVKYRIGYRSFFQVNSLQAEKLYQRAIEYANLTGKERAVDCYSGIGSIALAIAGSVSKVFGIEIFKPAVIDARNNAVLNHITNAFFEVGDAAKVLKKWNQYKFDVLFVDPPRRGCSKEFLDVVSAMKIPRIVYISCDQETLGRDLVLLTQSGYVVREITPVDMFPLTTHVESVTLLSLKTA